MASIKCDDTVRKPADMRPADLEGLEGRWVDVPRLQQKSTEVRSGFWCGRASAAMVYNFICKAQSKTDQYIGHDDGEAGVGVNGGKFNLRFLGGPNKGKLAGVDESGKVDPALIFTAAGWKIDSGELARDGNVTTDPASVEKRFARHIEQLKKNNPVVQYTLLSQDRGHIVVINGYKKDSDKGELWLRVVDPDSPHEDLLGSRNYQMITRPEKDKEFSEYWVKAVRFFETHPSKTGKKLFQHGDAETGHFFYALPDKPVKDDHETVHKVGKGLGATAGKPENDDPAPASGKDGQSAGGKSGAADAGGKPGGAGAGGKPAGAGGKDAKSDDKAGPPAACPPLTGVPRLPFMLNGSNLVTGEAITSLYHQTERGPGGFFPLGESGLFHSGAHVQPAPNAPIMAMADGEVVAARIGMGPGEHAWGDTGFVILRHKVKGDKNVYCLYLHLKKEPLHPDGTDAQWLKRLLIDAMQDPKAPKKPKWRVMEPQPTWKDADKGKFSPTNIQLDDKLEAGVYEEDEELVTDAKRYVKLKGKWVRALGPDGNGGKVKELSPWADFDLEAACKNAPHVKELRDGKTAVFDDLKAEDGKGHKCVVEAGETVGRSGTYLGAATLHWSVFSKDAVFPAGSLGEEEFKAGEQPKLKDLDLSSKEHGTKEHATALIEALDEKKKYIGSKEMEWIVEPGELQLFYRTPTQCWRGRYQAVKGLADFKLDLDKLTRHDRYKSHTDGEKTDFVKTGKAFLFWDDLAKAEDFPTDGKAIFVHPATALRLMSQVRVEQDHDDPPAPSGANAGDRLHPAEDVVLVVRDAKGPLAAVDVTVKADGKEVLKGKTDSQGEIVVKIEDVVGKDIEVSVDNSVVGDKGQLVQVANETAAPATLQPGDAPGNQTFNGDEVVPNPRLGLKMKAKKGAFIKQYGKWDAEKFDVEAPGKLLEPEQSITVERIVFRSDDGKKECVSFLAGTSEVFAWSIENGEEKLLVDLPADQQKKEPDAIASWSSRIAHLKDHPVLAGRVQNIDDGTEIEVTWSAMMSVGAPEHDHELAKAKCKTAAGGFAAAFDPHVLTADSGLLNAPRPVYGSLKVKDKILKLRDQALTIYGDSQFPDSKPKPPPPGATPQNAPATQVTAYVDISRDDATDKLNSWTKVAFPTRKLTQLTGAVTHRLVGDGADEIYLAACQPSQHIALDSQRGGTIGDALAKHTAALKASFPDAPEWVIARDADSAFKAGNGLQTGICATDCKSGVARDGKKAGCTEAVRQSNLGSCHNGTASMCQTAVQLGVNKTVKKDGCPAEPASCGAAQHDKSHCFLAGAVAHDDAENRERWHVRLPMRTAGAGYPYLRDNGKNGRVVLINPSNGAAVVCSQEARGPSAKCDANVAVAEAAVEKNEFAGKDTVIMASYETFWKLGLPRSGDGDAVVLIAWVDLNTPLGPVAEGMPVKLKKMTDYGTLMGDTAPVVPGVPGEKVKSSNIRVGGMHFVDWYNNVLRKQLWPGVNSDFLYLGQKHENFPGPINKGNFVKIFDNVEHLWAKEVTLQEFLAMLMIFCNETGGKLAAIAERGSKKYWFEEIKGKKGSYNKGIKAGDGLRKQGVQLDDAAYQAWNGVGPYPDDSGLEAQLKECDFVKFRGHGLIQLTFRSNYVAHCEPALKEHYGKGLDDLSHDELEKIILEDPKVYLRMVKSFFKAGGKMAKCNQNDWFPNGCVVAGGSASGQIYAKLYNFRCSTAFDEITKAGYEFR